MITRKTFDNNHINILDTSSKPKDGKSAYELAVENGFSGSVTEWLDSMKGGIKDIIKISSSNITINTGVMTSMNASYITTNNVTTGSFVVSGHTVVVARDCPALIIGKINSPKPTDSTLTGTGNAITLRCVIKITRSSNNNTSIVSDSRHFLLKEYNDLSEFSTETIEQLYAGDAVFVQCAMYNATAPRDKAQLELMIVALN